MHLRLDRIAEPTGQFDLTLIHNHCSRGQLPIRAGFMNDSGLVKIERSLIECALRSKFITVGRDLTIKGDREGNGLLSLRHRLEGPSLTDKFHLGAAGQKDRIGIMQVSHLYVGGDLRLITQNKGGGNDGPADMNWECAREADIGAGGLDGGRLVTI